MFNFEKLLVWRKALDFADMAYEVSGQFPSHEQFGLISQVRRSAVSVSSNIAEGASRRSPADYTRFLEIASGSLFECVSQLHLARRRNFVSEISFNDLYTAAEEISRMLSGLKSSLEEKSAR